MYLDLDMVFSTDQVHSFAERNISQSYSRAELCKHASLFGYVDQHFFPSLMKSKQKY